MMQRKGEHFFRYNHLLVSGTVRFCWPLYAVTKWNIRNSWSLATCWLFSVGNIVYWHDIKWRGFLRSIVFVTGCTDTDRDGGGESVVDAGVVMVHGEGRGKNHEAWRVARHLYLSLPRAVLHTLSIGVLRNNNANNTQKTKIVVLNKPLITK